MKRVIIVGACLLIAGAAVWLYPVVSFVGGLDHLIKKRERQLLYDTDHRALAEIMRDFATERQWSSGQPPRSDFGDFVHFPSNDPSLPPAVRLLKPSGVVIFSDRVELEFGGALLHFGVAVFRPGIAGEGTKQLGEGIWFYAENGRVPSE